MDYTVARIPCFTQVLNGIKPGAFIEKPQEKYYKIALQMHASSSKNPEAQTELWPSKLARWVLAAFLLTFVLARILVLLIMSRRIPDFFLFVGQTHVHHLNYGIFLLVTVGAWLLLFPPANKARRNAAIVYGVGLGLTFDEFGMWLHLGGSYWQRSSYDAVVVIAVLLALVSFGSDLRMFKIREWLWLMAIAVAVLIAAYLTAERLRQLSPELHAIEDAFPH